MFLWTSVYTAMNKFTCCCVGVRVSLSGVFVSATVPEHAPVRCAQEGPAVARYSQHQSHRRPQSPTDGRQRPQRPLRQIQDGTPEVQEQGKRTPV